MIRPAVSLALLGTTTLAQEPSTPELPRTGYFQTLLEERHPLGGIDELRRRFGWTEEEIREHDPDAEGAIDLRRETFRMWVPADYDPSTRYALLVWISPGGTGELLQDWPEALRKHDVIVVGPDRAGNDELVWRRIGLALHAVSGVSARYSVDPDRVYVTGHSGGGRVASSLAVTFPDVFRGGIYMAGCNHFREVPVPGQPGMRWPARIPRPRGERLRLVKRQSRHVFVFGENDGNRTQARGVHDDWVRRDRFEHVLWIDMPGKGHAPADAVALDRALTFFEQRDDERR